MNGKHIIILLFFFFVSSLEAQNYQVDDKASSVKFVIQNAGMATEGKFSGLAGSIIFNPASLKTASISVTIDAGSINTEIDIRDLALQSTEYLDTKNYPEFSFSSKQMIATDKEDRFMLKGAISLKGISKDISFPFTVSQIDNGILLKGDMKLNRRDFKIGLNSVVLSDLIIVTLSVVAKKI